MMGSGENDEEEGSVVDSLSSTLNDTQVGTFVSPQSPDQPSDDQNQSLMDALNAAHPQGEGQSLVVSESHMEPPSELANASDEVVFQDGEFDLGGAIQEESSLENFEGLGPNENSDPALAVDEMLTAAILSEEAPEEDLLLASELNSAPSFRLQFHPESEAQKEALKALVAAQSLEISDSPEATPMLGHLNEFQALLIRQSALAKGIRVNVLVKFPMPALSEEDQALGDLAAVSDIPSVTSEGAPSVVLLKKESEVLLLADSMAGCSLIESKGIITAHRSIARRFFREEEAQEKLKRELSRVPGKQASLPASRLEGLFRELFLDLQKSALNKGANAVIGLRLDAFPETSSLDPSLEQLRLVAFGTAAVVEKA